MNAVMTATDAEHLPDFQTLMKRHKETLEGWIASITDRRRRQTEKLKLENMEIFDSTSYAYKVNEMIWENLTVERGIPIHSFSDLQKLIEITSVGKVPFDVGKLFDILNLEKESTRGIKQHLIQKFVKNHMGITISPPTIIEDGDDLESPDWMYQDPEKMVPEMN